MSEAIKFEDSESARVRWGDIAARVWAGWLVVWEDVLADYQGHAEFVAKHPTRENWVHYRWSYGSCSGCDRWENEPYERVVEEMIMQASFFSSVDVLLRYARNIEKEGRGSLLDDERKRGETMLAAVEAWVARERAKKGD